MAPPVSTSTRPFGVIAAISIVFNAGIAAIDIVSATAAIRVLGISAVVSAVIFTGIGVVSAIAAICVGVVSAGITTASLADILSIITFAITITLRFLLVVHEGCLSDCVLAPFFLYPGQGKKREVRRRRPWPARQ